jgi:hypothetical protein
MRAAPATHGFGDPSQLASGRRRDRAPAHQAHQDARDDVPVSVASMTTTPTRHDGDDDDDFGGGGVTIGCEGRG